MLIATCRCGPRRSNRSTFASDAATKRSARLDPTGTLALRNRFRMQMDSRWDKMRRMARDFIDQNSSLGISGVSVQSIAHSAQMSLLRPAAGADKVKTFQAWFDEALRQVVLAGSGTWTTPFIQKSADAATARAKTLTKKIEVEPASRVQVIASQTIVELQGVCEAASQQAVRAFSNGLLQKKRASQVASDVARVIRSIGRVRSRQLVQFQMVSMFTAATLDAFRAAGIKKVGSVAERVRVVKGPHGKTLARDAPVDEGDVELQIDPELRSELLAPLGEVDVLTAGDDDVCPECQDISDSGPYEIDEAETLIPAHPNCRCAFVPTEDERFASVEGDDS